MTNSRAIWATVACFAALMALCVVISIPASAQTITTGEVVGTVSDPSGAAVAGAAVSLKDLARGAVEDTKTDKDGVYHFLELLPGDYSVSVTAPGFKTFTRQAHVAVGQVATADAKLELGQTSQTVEVTGEVPLLQTENGNLGATVNESQTQNIPNPGNDLTYTAQVTPGTTMNNGGSGYGNFSSFGVSATSNLFTLDGMDNNDPFLNLNNSGATDLSLGLNEVAEVSVVGDGYSGEYGGLAGANVNILTHGGTNSFHGHAIWQWNGSSMDANDWFKNANETPKSFVNANQYGGDVGGPIVKNKLFFYFDAEGLYLLIPTSGEVVIPSSQFATAVQTNINNNYGGANSTIAKFYANMFHLYAAAPGANRAKNTLPDQGCDFSETEDIPSGGGVEDVGRGFADPDPTVAANTFGIVGGTVFGSGAGSQPCALDFITNVGNGTHENLQAWRADWNITDKDRFFFRMQHDLGEQASYTDAISPLFNGQSNQPEWQGQIEETHDFSSGAVNQLILAGQWYSALFTNKDSAATLAAFPSTLSFAAGQLSNLGGIDYYWPEGRRVSQAQVSDDFAKPFGAHTFKIGVKFRENWVTNQDYGIESQGINIPITLDAFFWGGADPVNFFADNPNTPGPNISEGLQNFPSSVEQPFSVWNIGGYIEDDWKIKPNFTLTLAFRGDHANIPTCGHKCFALPTTQFTSLSTSADTPYNKLIQVGQTSMLPSLTAFEPQPRIGFAWRIHQNTVVRGGAGIFFDNYPGALLDNYSENPPLDPQFIVASGTISTAQDPASLLYSAAASNAAFQAGFKSGQSFNQISESVPGFTAPGIASSDTYPKEPQYQKWSLEVEQSFGANTSFSVEYVGNHGIHILDQNLGINGCNNSGEFTSLPDCLTPTGSGLNPSFAEATFAQSIGVASYNGVTLSFTHRYKSGQVQLNYTYSHTLDDVSNSGEEPFSDSNLGAANNSQLYPEDPFDPSRNYGSADQDVRHMLTINYVWELPIKRFLTFGHGPDRLLKGWQVSGLVLVRSGFPYTLTDGGTTSGLSSGGYGAEVFGTQIGTGGAGFNCQTVGNESGNPQPSLGICLNPDKYTPSPSGFGNVGRNTIRGPSFWNADFSLMKKIPIAEGVDLQIGAQMFNVFNHPNFSAPVTDVSNPFFGQVVNTLSPPTSIFGAFLGADASPRLIQLKLEASF